MAENGRSVLGDVLSKLELFTSSQMVLVSGMTARDLETPCEAAAISHDAPAFQERLDASDRQLRRRFEDKLLIPHFSRSLANTWRTLRRIRVVGWTESEMIRPTDQRIRGALYRSWWHPPRCDGGLESPRGDGARLVRTSDSPAANH